MDGRWKQTLHWLAHTENDAAVPVLVAALDSPHVNLQVAALEALLERRNPQGLQQILDRLNPIPDAWHDVLSEKSGRLANTFRDAVVGDDYRRASLACEAICVFREFDLMPSLLTALEADSGPQAELFGQAVVRLAEALSSELDQTPDRRRRDPQFVRRSLVAALEKSVERFSKHRRKEAIEAFLMLASRENASLKQILLDPQNPCTPDVLRVLKTSDRPGVFRLLLSFIDDPHAPLAALGVLTSRTDAAFVKALLDKMAEDHRSVALYNFQRLEQIGWATAEHTHLLDELTEEQQATAVRFIAGSGMPRGATVNAILHLAQRGGVPARRAAMETLAGYPGAEVTAAVLKGLDDPDHLVVAHAARQLRPRNVPGSVSRLIALAGHPHMAVRQAVHECLTEFSCEKYLASFDHLEPAVRRSTGELVFKIDPSAAQTLRKELQTQTRWRRLRGIAMVVAMNAIADMEADLIERLEDDDHRVRIEAIEALAMRDSEAARQALLIALTDPSVQVQQAASSGLHRQEELTANLDNMEYGS